MEQDARHACVAWRCFIETAKVAAANVIAMRGEFRRPLRRAKDRAVSADAILVGVDAGGSGFLSAPHEPVGGVGSEFDAGFDDDFVLRRIERRRGAGAFGGDPALVCLGDLFLAGEAKVQRVERRVQQFLSCPVTHRCKVRHPLTG